MAALALSACAPEECTLENDELSMVARVVDTGQNIRVEVDFASGDRAKIRIPWTACDGDRILINGEDAEETVRDDRTEYTRSFDTDAPETITVELDRADKDAVAASVSRPDPFEILEPAPESELSRSDEHLLTWEPPVPDGEMQVELLEEIGGGRCIVTATPEHDYKGVGGVRVEDKGSWTIPAGVLTNDGVSECEARYVLSRFNQAEYPDALAPGGFVEAQVVRIRVFDSVP